MKDSLVLQQARGCTHRIAEARQEMLGNAEKRRLLVKTLRESGWSYAEIAEGLGCTRSAVQSILRGLT